VAARGIDIPDLELVIHAELPIDAAVMQHRSGRTGRAGRKGVSAVLVPHPRRRRAESLFKAAALEVSWTSPPSAEDVRARDQERLAVQLRPSGDASEEDLAVARALLAEASPERVVAGLVRASRASLPAPEDLVDAEPEAPLRPAARPGFEDTVWFSIDIGRTKNADPKWLLPLICRRGHVTKRDIGAIRVFDRETRFEIVRPLAERFLAAADKGAEEGGRIQVLTDPESPPPHDRKPFRRPKPDFAARAPETPGPGFPGASERTADRGERAFLERPASPAPPRGQGRGPAAAKPPRPHTSKRQAAKSGGRPDGRRPPRS
jgi:ATP-dependent RNA helicase DeaD